MQNKTLKNWQGIICVMGVDWGDSGKGRLIDDLASRAHVVARYNGGANAGHTVENKFGKFALHIIPSGIFHKDAICLVGRNVAVDLESVAEEIETLRIAQVPAKNLIIDEQASLTMPWHKLRDGIREKSRKNKVGTTGRGIGPTYADRTERVGLLAKDIKEPDFNDKINEEVKIQNKFYALNLNSKQITEKYKMIASKIGRLVGRTTEIISEAVKSNKNILFEGAQGYFLDIDAGTYPFVTSSNPGVIGVWRSFDLHPAEIDEVIGITKAYTTRVGQGPLPTKMPNDIAAKIVKTGKEFGTTTGRQRSPGWLDIPLIKAANASNHLTGLAITKLDVFSQLQKIKLCTKYEIEGKEVSYLSHDAQVLQKVTPIYQEYDGWRQNIEETRNFSDLPKPAQKYIRAVEDLTKIPVKFISVGPKRGQVIYV